MKTNFIPLLSSIILLILGFSNAEAQTCRVSAGYSGNGLQTYKEVFEYDYVEVKPSFPGGNEALLDYINKNRQYPADAYEHGIEGRVTCSFVVNADGNISNIRVIKGCHKSLNTEAVRLLTEMPSWLPGRQSAHCVPVRVVHCIPFRK
ncbi:MAG: energy transducer TonB [Muribaculaceae bacterium]|nr:energy transducer TonB [Muribaculaceae bacterium]MDE6521659.1 energy transducer TonB [Muribaculaceae bacterium]MDE6786724.1 energy transducer TonB [Muribaculaceae bacterium]